MDSDICLGCGVCADKCPTHALTMINRGDRVIHPDTLFDTYMPGSLERGTLQNQIFDNPLSRTQRYMRSFMGAFIRLSPVKRALMSDALMSSFLRFMKVGGTLQRQG